jgi:thiamine biosynthesis lipoprotein
MTDELNLSTARAFHFDTFNTIVAQADPAVLQEALRMCSLYEKLLSRFVEGSDVWRLNHSQGRSVEVHPETLRVLHCAEAVREASRGAFNIAVGIASDLWNFGSSTPKLPDAAELSRVAQALRDFKIASDDLTVAIPTALQIDLGGIAKGYICDRIADVLRDQGVDCALLNFGGNVVTVGEHPAGRPWQVGIQTPGRQRESNIFALLDCENTAVVTSGVYERGFVVDGRLYHHILDPRTCWPAQTDLLSVTVVSPDSMFADALATAILVLGTQDGLSLAQRFGAQVVLLEKGNRLTYSRDLSLQALGNTDTNDVAIRLLETP